VSAKTCGCPDGYPLIGDWPGYPETGDWVRHTGRCPFADETLTAYKERLAAAHVHDYETVRRCKTCGAEETLT